MSPPAYDFVRAMPVLEVADMARSLAFYKERLGFSAATWGEPATFAIVQRGTLSLGLVVRAASRNWAAYLYVRDVDRLYDELRAHGVTVPEPPVTQPYNCREISIDDPDGHILGVGQVLVPDPIGPGLSARVGRDALPQREPARTARQPATAPGAWSGGCQCGAVRFRVDDLGRASLCHCRMCQKAFGSIGGLLVTAHAMTWTRGAPRHFQSSNKVRRGYCADCGTPLTFEYDGKVDVAIAAFDRAAEIPPVIQMARAERLPFVDGIDEIPVRPDEPQWRANWVDTIVSYQHPDHDTDAWETKQ